MIEAAKLHAISCPTCGAGLDVLGGGRVTTHICGYCGTALDAIEGYRVLARFADMKRPDTPLRIGDRGTVFGVEHVVIGVLGQGESWKGRHWAWVDHLLHSPSHGYGWLTLENGHLLYSRRWRRPVAPRWMSTRQVETSEHRPTCSSAGEQFAYYETSTSEITFAEGEFTWRPAVGDRVTTVSALGPATMLSFIEGATEREIERSWYLPQAETWQAFGVAPDHRPPASGDHPLRPCKEPANARFLTLASSAFAALCMVLALVLSTMNGQVVLPPTDVARSSLPTEIKLPITTVDRLTQVNLTGSLQDNSWAWVEVTLLDPDDRPLFQLGREIGAYSGIDSEGRWSENYSGTTLRFRPEIAGTYTLELDVPEAGLGEGASPAIPPDIRISARTGLSSAVPPMVLALLFGLVTGGLLFAAELRRRHRWAGSDWDEEDSA